MKVSTSYVGRTRFESGAGAARVVLDAPEKAGGRGEALTPKAMVLQGLVGCTGLDVAAILEKGEVPFEDLRVEAAASQTRTMPKVFDRIDITYRVKAAEEDRPAIEKAIKASQTRFCGVSHMLRKTAEVEWTLELEPRQ